jgi:hypothetical protein
MEPADSPDVMIAKRLLDYAKQGGFTFQRAAPGEDGPLVGYRVSDHCVDLIHIEGFSRDCFAWRKRISPLIMSQDALVRRRIEGSALDVLNEVLTWEPGPRLSPHVRVFHRKRRLAAGGAATPDAWLPAASRPPTSLAI